MNRRSASQKKYSNPYGWERQVRISLILLLFLMTVPVMGDRSGFDAAWPRSSYDDHENLVILEKIPYRIVSLAPSNTENLFLLGLHERIIGVTDYCDYPEEATGKEKIGGFSTLSLEKVVALKPDMVVASAGNNQEVIERIKSLGIPLYFVEPKNLNHIYETLENLGYLTGTESEADKLIMNLKEREENVRRSGEDVIDKPSVAHIIWYEPIYVSGADTFQDELIKTAGGINAFESKTGHAIVSLEEFINSNPDILIINTGSGMGESEDDIAGYFKTEPRLSGLQAIINDNIIMVNSDVADRSGPRLWDLLEEIAPKIRART